ncbi:hypothetical protein ABT337_05400 [Saccharopolyspora hirsuta]|uniref:Uncharacterized protein n=1 Tax=Saccharopolyspora hirsuta TaxID=1837 RepID=A0A5M7CD85_SACHI|nr:hypothetical protein [Saccharopolyspora hirsuta]KAA5838128.1 hypothetical protein F1721_01345 [Saccharopolyspora hirsuta]
MDLITKCSELPHEQLCEEIRIAGLARKQALDSGSEADVEMAESVLDWYLDELAERLRRGRVPDVRTVRDSREDEPVPQ